MFRKTSLLICAALILSLLTGLTAVAADPIMVLIDGEELECEVPPHIIDNRAMVPMRAIFEELGAKVDWNDATRTITATRYDLELISVVGDKNLIINGETFEMDVVPVIKYNRTLVPARFISEAFGCEVDWDEETRTVYIYTPEPVMKDGGSLNGGGGQKEVVGYTEYTFTPDSDGLWAFRTLSSGKDDPVLTICTFDEEYIASDNDSGGDLDALLVVYLIEGRTYVLYAGFSHIDSAKYTLSWSKLDLLSFTGDSMDVDSTKGYTYTPADSGWWEIYTSTDDADTDPFVVVFSSDGDVLGFSDDDMSEEDYNARLLLFLDAGEEYIIYTGFYEGVVGPCKLNISKYIVEPLAGGGDTKIAPDMVIYSFIPASSGAWEFSVSNEDYGALVIIYDDSGEILCKDFDENEWLRDYIILYLNAGETYYIRAAVNYIVDEDFTLKVAPAQSLPGIGGTIHVSGTTGYTFKPVSSDYWTFSTSTDDDSDPYLMLYSIDGEYIDSHDDIDIEEEEYNAMLSADLDKDTTYIVYVMFYDEGSLSCDLRIGVG